MKLKNHMITSIKAEKEFDKIQNPVMIKTQQTRNRRKLLQIIKTIYEETITNITLNSKKLKTFPLRSGTRQRCPFSPLPFNIVLKVLIGEIKKKKRHPK